MGILSRLQKRYTAAQKEIRGAQSRAKQEVKESAKTQARREKLLANLEKDLLKAEQKGLKDKRKHERKLAKQEYEKIKAGKINASRINRWANAARVALPIVLPLVYRGITAGREQLVNARAKQAGVSPTELAHHSGYGASHKARIAGLREELENADVPIGFKNNMNERLDTLSAAANNAGYMSADQRRRSLAAVNRDINKVAEEIQERIRQRP